MEKVKILGKTVQAEFTSPAFIKKYEDALRMVYEEASKSEDEETASKAIKAQCDAVVHLTDNLFGSGSADEILGKEASLLVCLDALIEIASVYESQINPMIEEKKKKVVRLIGKDKQ